MGSKKRNSQALTWTPCLSRQKANHAKRNIQAVSTHIASLQTRVLALHETLLAQPSSKTAAQDSQEAIADLVDLADCTAATIDSLLAGVASTIDKLCNDPLPSEANQQKILQQQQEQPQQVAKLNKIVSAMRRQAVDVTGTYESDRRHMHLGQIAKILDAAAVEYIGYNFRRATLDDIQDASTAGQLPNLEQQHWEEFQKFLTCTYGSCEDALHVARTLRSNAHTVTLAHADEYAAVTKADLFGYTDLEYGGEANQDIKGLIKVVADLLTVPLRPLQFAAHAVRPVVEEVLQPLEAPSVLTEGKDDNFLIFS